MTPMALIRKAGLTLHVICSLGWLGAVLCFLVLAVLALVSPVAITLQSAYVTMDVVARFVILPLCLASLLTGVVQSLIGKWGLVRHYWVLFKLILNVLATFVLLAHMRPIGELAQAAVQGPLAQGSLYALRLQVTLDAAAALVVLVAATVLGVYKPRGVTPFGLRTSQT